jgi:hypothetical protein
MDSKNIDTFLLVYEQAKYCPICGESLKLAKTIRDMFTSSIKHILASIPETVEIDGKTLVYDRTPLSPITLENEEPTDEGVRIKPFDPDNVDISKELEMLKKYNDNLKGTSYE